MGETPMCRCGRYVECRCKTVFGREAEELGDGLVKVELYVECESLMSCPLAPATALPAERAAGVIVFGRVAEELGDGRVRVELTDCYYRR